ncbi:UNVERIFIED_CONTAM: hypothetical protein Slati_0200800 [Sesamum latifolium]|uniref:Reverse transcriptase Ty1/copia-type domain-containing protein n=1 Tax=Sesamum latifolium TaxID=2727402 RepID=A0AAW2YCD4_9LAMI
MDQPEGFTAVGEEQKVCHLQRSIYGLKQASRSWNTRFDEVIRGYDFIKNDYDPCESARPGLKGPSRRFNATKANKRHIKLIGFKGCALGILPGIRCDINKQ